jgi:hypothetical protein
MFVAEAKIFQYLEDMVFVKLAEHVCRATLLTINDMRLQRKR